MTTLNEAFAAAGAAAWGGLPFSELAADMTAQAVARAEELCPHPRTVLVAAFPYYAGAGAGNLSCYARGRDYHLVVPEKLNTVCNFLKEKYKNGRFLPAADNSPLPERQAAWRCGVGLRGKHGLVILPPYGSYVFLGTILTDAVLEVPRRDPSPDCIGCGKCLTACPGKALGEGGVELDRCLSELTQRKGELTQAQEALVRAHPLVWGCDTCQQVCPYNAHPAVTPLAEFREGLVEGLTGADLAGLTNRQFREKYEDRAFAWRGPAPLRRNFEWKET